MKVAEDFPTSEFCCFLIKPKCPFDDRATKLSRCCSLLSGTSYKCGRIFRCYLSIISFANSIFGTRVDGSSAVRWHKRYLRRPGLITWHLQREWTATNVRRQSAYKTTSETWKEVKIWNGMSLCIEMFNKFHSDEINRLNLTGKKI